MTNEEAIQGLLNVKAQMAEESPSTEAIDLAVKALDGFADGVEEGKQLANVWIPVTERLPKTEKWPFFRWFITTTADGCVIPMAWENTTVRGKAVSRWIYQGRISPWEVIAWMPLPKPYKEVEE